MSEQEHVPVAVVSDGRGGSGEPGTRVRLRAGELLRSRGLIAGSRSAEPAAAARLLADRLLNGGHGVVLLDRTGSFGDLAGAPEILHCGTGPHCDLTASPEDAESLAGMALERRLPVLVDLSSLTAEAAEATTAAIAQALPAGAGPDTAPVLLLVDGVHELLPADGDPDEAGTALLDLARHGSDLGLGVCGVTRRPGDLDPRFVSLSDWAAWHRLTRTPDRQALRRELDGEYRDAAGNLEDGEAFLVTDWSNSIRRVAFDEHEPQYSDGFQPAGSGEAAGADGEDEALGDLLADGAQPAEPTVAELRDELADIDARIDNLEARVAATRDLDELADRLAEAMVAAQDRTDREAGAAAEASSDSDSPSESTRLDPHPDWPPWPGEEGDETDAATQHGRGEATEPTPDTEAGDTEMAFEAFSAMADADAAGSGSPSSTNGDAAGTAEGATGSSDDDVAAAFEWYGDQDDEGAALPEEGTVATDVEGVLERDSTDRAETERREREAAVRKPAFVRRLVREVQALEPPARAMLVHYVESGPSTPIGAYLNATGHEDRNIAYAHNRSLRSNGLVRHVGRGQYAPCLRQLLAEAASSDLEPEALDRYASHVARQAVSE